MQNVSLKPFNTFGVEVKARELIEVSSREDLVKRENILILGEGANILFTKDFDGLVLLNKLKGRKVVSENSDEVIIEVASGENFNDLVMWSVENNWSGMENLALIPGTVGGAAMGNIGAYGQSVGEIILAVNTINLDSLEEKEYSNSECLFYYRDSIFKSQLQNKIIISSVQFKLSKKAHFDTHYFSKYESLESELFKFATKPYKPRDVAQAVINLRKNKLPDWKKIGTAGSFFKNPFVDLEKYEQLKSNMPDLQVYPVNKMLYPNPDDPIFGMADVVKIPAGRLLDELGWRGKRIGNVGTFDKHALVVVSYGATGQEILDFTNLMKADVQKNFDVELEPEVRIV